MGDDFSDHRRLFQQQLVELGQGPVVINDENAVGIAFLGRRQLVEGLDEAGDVQGFGEKTLHPGAHRLQSAGQVVVLAEYDGRR
jgi:hypothetical protein